jgi:hypothetical protein
MGVILALSFADLEGSSMGPRGDWRGNRCNVFVKGNANPNVSPSQEATYEQNTF